MNKAMKCAAIVFAALTMTAACACAQSAVVESGGVNLRTAPSKQAKPLGLLYGGTQVDVVADAGDGWAEVFIGGSEGSVSGYVMSEYLSLDAGSAGDETKKCSVVSPYGTQAVVLRDRPSDSYDAVAMLPVGSSVRVIGESGDYYYVQTNDACVGCLSSDEIH